MSGVRRSVFGALFCGVIMLARSIAASVLLAVASAVLAGPVHAAGPVPAPVPAAARGNASYPLSTLLGELARNTGTELLYDERLVHGVKAKRPARRQPVATALHTLLDGTGVGYRRTQDGAYVLFTLAGTQGASDEAPAVPPVPDILVVGRRLLNMDIKRTENDVQPYKVFDRDEIDTAHRDNLNLFFKARLPANTDLLPPTQQILSAYGSTQSTIDLRGAGARRTLVLIDGRRLPSLPGLIGDFDQSDLNGVPMGAISRIEVLTSTAGGIYGQNATGGVVNVVLRRDYRGAELNIVSGITSRGDAARLRVEGRIGLSNADGSTQLMAFGAYAISDRLRAGQRDYIVRAREIAYANDREGYVFPGGFSANTPVSNSITIQNLFNAPLTFNAANGGGSLGSRYTYLPLNFQGTDEEKRAVLLANAGKVDLSLSPGPSGAGRSLLSNPTVLSAIASARHQFGGDGPEIFLDGIYFRNEGVNHQYAVPGQIQTSPDAPGSPFAQRIFTRFPSEIDFVNRTRITLYRLVAGVIVPLPGGWRAEADASFGKMRLYIEQLIAPFFDTTGIYTNAIFTGMPGPDGRPPLRPLQDWKAFQAALPAYVTYGPNDLPLENRFTNLSLRLAGPLLRLPGGPALLTMLLERRREFLPTELTDAAPPGQETPYRVSVVRSAYAELRAPLLPRERGFLPLRGLEFQLAVRHDALRATFPNDFLNFGQTVTHLTQRRSATVFTAGARILPIPALMLRGSYATGTVPPEMNQFQSSDLTGPDQYSWFARDTKRGNRVVGSEGPYLTRIGGSHEIQQETGNTLALGLVINPFQPGPRLSIDYSRISISREITLPGLGAQELLAREDEYPGRIIRAPLTDEDRALGFTGGRLLVADLRMSNSGSTRIHAVDLQFNWPMRDTWGGELEPYASATWLPSITTRFSSHEPWTQRVDHRDNPIRWRANGGVRWHKWPANVDLNMQYYHSYQIVASGPDNSNEQQIRRFQGADRVPAQFYVDLAAGWMFELGGQAPVRAVSVRFGIQNLFDHSPPIIAEPDGRGYSPYGDPRRRRFELTISIRR